MIIRPKTRGFVCITAHPDGCSRHVQDQLDYVQGQGPIQDGPKRVLILGASTGYGLASRLVAIKGCKAATLGVFFERPSSNGRPASAGWYNSVAAEEAARKEGLYAKSINGDAYSDEIKTEVIRELKENVGPVDLVIYSLAAPRRTDPRTGQTYKSTLKPIGARFEAMNLDTDRKKVEPVSLEPASDEEIEATVKVMGGEDWEIWMEALAAENLIAEGCVSVAYDYIGPEVTWPVYHNGTIGKAKEHLRQSSKRIDALLKIHRGAAFISVNKAVVTQASSAIPVVPLYISILFKVMKEANLHEDCIHQIDRLFRTQLFNGSAADLDENGCIRMDDWEMKPEVQERVKNLWGQVNTETIDSLTDFSGYQENFLRLFGFGLPGVDYEADVEPERALPSA